MLESQLSSNMMSEFSHRTPVRFQCCVCSSTPAPRRCAWLRVVPHSGNGGESQVLVLVPTLPRAPPRLKHIPDWQPRSSSIVLHSRTPARGPPLVPPDETHPRRILRPYCGAPPPNPPFAAGAPAPPPPMATDLGSPYSTLIITAPFHAHRRLPPLPGAPKRPTESTPVAGPASSARPTAAHCRGAAARTTFGTLPGARLQQPPPVSGEGGVWRPCVSCGSDNSLHGDEEVTVGAHVTAPAPTRHRSTARFSGPTVARPPPRPVPRRLPVFHSSRGPPLPNRAPQATAGEFRGSPARTCFPPPRWKS